MRKLVIISVLLILACNGSKPADKDFNSFYSEHENDEGVVSFGIPVFLVKMFIDNSEDEQIEEILDKLNNVKLFVCEDTSKNYAQIIEPYLPESIYSDLMVINEDNKKISFKMRKPEKEKIEEIILTVVSPDIFTAMKFSGNFTVEDAKKLTKAVKTNEVQNHKW